MAETAIASIDDFPHLLRAQGIDPDFAFQYRAPNRRWWQLWKPRWRVVQVLSRNQRRRNEGKPLLPPSAVKIGFC